MLQIWFVCGSEFCNLVYNNGIGNGTAEHFTSTKQNRLSCKNEILTQKCVLKVVHFFHRHHGRRLQQGLPPQEERAW